MNEFKYTSRPYVSRVNLETLGKSFDILEQGHKEAVKTASDLKTAIYNLQMDNSENGFKDQLISEIQKTIDDNTVYGNSYAALDDIITDGENGFCVKAFDQKEYVKKLRELVGDSELRHRMANSGIKSVERYNVEHIGALWIDNFERMLQLDKP